MKKWLKRFGIIIGLATALSARAAFPTTITFAFDWSISTDTNDLAGLSTNDYMTNITFRLYATTNIALPTSAWTVVATWPGQPFLSQGPLGSTWTNSVVTDSHSRFFALAAYSANALSEGGNGGESPFSNVALVLAPLLPGHLSVRK